jgi:hypothetical protein
MLKQLLVWIGGGGFSIAALTGLLTYVEQVSSPSDAYAKVLIDAQRQVGIVTRLPPSDPKAADMLALIEGPLDRYDNQPLRQAGTCFIQHWSVAEKECGSTVRQVYNSCLSYYQYGWIRHIISPRDTNGLCNDTGFKMQHERCGGSC